MSFAVLDQLRPLFGDETWFRKATEREKTKTPEQRELDYELWIACKNQFRITKYPNYKNFYTEALRLIELGATNDYQESRNGFSALHYACAEDMVDVVDAILDRFPEEIERKQIQNYHFCTPISNAFQRGHPNITQSLLSKGAMNPVHNCLSVAWCCDPIVTYNALEVLKQTNKLRFYITEDLNRMNELNLLIDLRILVGLNRLISYFINDETMQNHIFEVLGSMELEIPNHIYEHRSIYLMKWKEQFSGELWLQNSFERIMNKTYLQYVLDYSLVKSGNYDQAVNLISLGATRDYGTSLQSELHIACQNGRLDVAMKLVDRFPAEIENKLSDGYGTPISVAFQMGHFHICQWLLSKEAKNPVYNCLIRSEKCTAVITNNGLQVIQNTGKICLYITEDINRMNKLNVLLDRSILIGLNRLIAYYIKDQAILELIMDVLESIELNVMDKYKDRILNLMRIKQQSGHEGWLPGGLERIKDKSYLQYVLDFGMAESINDEVLLSLGGTGDIKDAESFIYDKQRLDVEKVYHAWYKKWSQTLIVDLVMATTRRNRNKTDSTYETRLRKVTTHFTDPFWPNGPYKTGYYKK